MAALKIIWKFLSNFPYHSFSVGAGSLLIGVAAYTALSKTDDVLKGVLRIQEIVTALQDERKVFTTSKRFPIYKEYFSPEQIDKNIPSYDRHNKALKQEDLKTLLPDENSDLKPGDIYLPSKALPLLKEKLASQNHRSDIYAERFLRENLQIWNPDKVKN